MIHVFVGPTVPAARVRDLRPRAQVHPPVVHGDLLRLDTRPGDVIVIIDGGYHQRPSIRHKEILLLLANGIAVIGCSSMGALRAAELAPYGMVGHGMVFEMYRREVIDGDDEVAVLHGEGPDYRPFSEPLVNMRHALAMARCAGIVTADEKTAILMHARRLPYTTRSWRALAFELERVDPPAYRAVRRVQALVEGAPELADVKAHDAVETLSHLDELLALRDHGTPSWAQPADWKHRYLFEWEANFLGCVVSGVRVDFGSVIRYRQLYDTEFPRRWARFVLRRIARGDPGGSDDELLAAATAVAADNGLDGASLTSAQLDEWVLGTERDLPPQELLRLVLVRSYRPARGIYDLLTGEPDLVRDEPTRQVVAESQVINSSIAGWAPRRSANHIKESVLRDHLAHAWRLSSNGARDLTAAARDRGFASAAEAIAACRPFFLWHYLSAVAPTGRAGAGR